jgi:hypothetical protein
MYSDVDKRETIPSGWNFTEAGRIASGTIVVEWL